MKVPPLPGRTGRPFLHKAHRQTLPGFHSPVVGDHPQHALTQLNKDIPSILLRTTASIETENQDRHARKERISYTEGVVDALALWADEGRGDRRNVPGELHAS